MAERRRCPSPESSTDPSADLLSSSPPPPIKKSKLSETGEALEATDDENPEADLSLETSEQLELSSSSSENASAVRECLDVSAGEPSTSGAIEESTKELGRRIMGKRTGTSGDESLVGEHAHYQELSKIGDGAYGTVYMAKDLTTGQVVALKRVRVPLTENGLPTSTLREIAGLKQLERFEHPHIVKLLDVCQGNYLQLPQRDTSTERSMERGLTLWLVFEHVEQDLASFISSSSAKLMTQELAKQMSKDILLGVDFLHSHRIIHRDLKPQNLLVTKDARIKIADFGLAKTYDFEMRLTSVVVTLWYRAPEVLLGCPYATPVDMWSVGCILAEINRRAPLFPGTSEGDELDRIFQIIGTPNREQWPKNVSLSWTAFPQRRKASLRTVIPEISEDGLDLIGKMLTFDPHTRLTAAQALNHKYFNDF